jgi:hypothetical protein
MGAFPVCLVHYCGKLIDFVFNQYETETMQTATAQQFTPLDVEIHPTVDTGTRDSPINAARLAKLEKKKRTHFSSSKEALQPDQPNDPPQPPAFLALELVTKPNLTTKELAYYSDMAEQSWRVKACYETYPAGLRPLRVCGKLAWPTAGAKKLLGVV